MMIRNKLIKYETNLSYKLIERKIYKKCTFTGVNMNNSRFYKCVFDNCKFINCDIVYTTFEECVFRDIDNNDSYCVFLGCNLSKSNLVLSTLRFNEFKYCNLDFMRLIDSSLQDVKVSESCSIWDIKYNSDSIIDDELKKRMEIYNTNI